MNFKSDPRGFYVQLCFGGDFVGEDGCDLTGGGVPVGRGTEVRCGVTAGGTVEPFL